MTSKGSTIPAWMGLITRVFFVFMTLSASIFVGTAVSALPGIFPKAEVLALWLIATLMGVAISFAPRRGQMTEHLSSNLLGALGLVMACIGNVLGRLTHYAHITDFMEKTLR